MAVSHSTAPDGGADDRFVGVGRQVGMKEVQDDTGLLKVGRFPR